VDARRGGGGRELIERAIDLGITFFDTANVYSNGESEAILGDVLAEYDRDRFTVATKVYGEMDESNPNSGGPRGRRSNRSWRTASIGSGWTRSTCIRSTGGTTTRRSRRRCPRSTTPCGGKVRYLGASSMWAHQFAEALHTSDREGYERFVTMQNLYNLAYREEEREMVPLCQREGIGMLPWSPLGAGYLTRPYEQDDATTRGEHETALGRPYREGGGEEINRRIEELADEKDVKMAQIALRWVAGKEVVDAPIVGTSSVEHLEDAVEALDVDLSDSDVEWLEEPYEAVRVSGHE